MCVKLVANTFGLAGCRCLTVVAFKPCRLVVVVLAVAVVVVVLAVFVAVAAAAFWHLLLGPKLIVTL